MTKKLTAKNGAKKQPLLQKQNIPGQTSPAVDREVLPLVSQLQALEVSPFQWAMSHQEVTVDPPADDSPFTKEVANGEDIKEEDERNITTWTRFRKRLRIFLLSVRGSQEGSYFRSSLRSYHELYKCIYSFILHLILTYVLLLYILLLYKLNMLCISSLYITYLSLS